MVTSSGYFQQTKQRSTSKLIPTTINPSLNPQYNSHKKKEDEEEEEQAKEIMKEINIIDQSDSSSNNCDPAVYLITTTGSATTNHSKIVHHTIDALLEASHQYVQSFNYPRTFVLINRFSISILFFLSRIMERIQRQQQPLPNKRPFSGLLPQHEKLAQRTRVGFDIVSIIIRTNTNIFFYPTIRTLLFVSNLMKWFLILFFAFPSPILFALIQTEIEKGQEYSLKKAKTMPLVFLCLYPRMENWSR